MTNFTDDGEIEYPEEKQKNDDAQIRIAQLNAETELKKSRMTLFGVIFTALIALIVALFPTNSDGDPYTPVAVAIAIAISGGSAEPSPTLEVTEVVPATVTPLIPTEIVITATPQIQPTQTPVVVIVTASPSRQTAREYCNWTTNWQEVGQNRYEWTGPLPNTADCPRIGQSPPLLDNMHNRVAVYTLTMNVGGDENNPLPVGIRLSEFVTIEADYYRPGIQSNGSQSGCFLDCERQEDWPHVAGEVTITGSTGFAIGDGCWGQN